MYFHNFDKLDTDLNAFLFFRLKSSKLLMSVSPGDRYISATPFVKGRMCVDALLEAPPTYDHHYHTITADRFRSTADDISRFICGTRSATTI